ncbi:MAG: PEP-CTERM sorting domain-containing protein [Pirellulales bacterium]
MIRNYLRSYLSKFRLGPKAAAFLFAATAVSLSPLAAQAVITDTDWSLKISEREMAFHPATDVMAMKTLMWDLPSSRQAARNVPFICLTNDSSTASISQFKMTIGDDQFHFGNTLFGTYAKLGKDTPGFSLSSTVENSGDTLIVNILNGGLAPGETVNFQIDLDVDAGLGFYKYPDYRTVLFDMNGDNYYDGSAIVNDPDSDDNSQVTLTFAQSGMPSVTTVPTAFPDPSVVDGSASYVNQNIARYGQNDPVRAFVLEGGGVVPEPSSVLLGLMGLVVTLGLSRRRGSNQLNRRTE